MPGIRIDSAVAAWCMGERGRDERAEGLRRQPMDLPEAARVDAEGAVADALEDDFTGGTGFGRAGPLVPIAAARPMAGVRARDHAHASVGWLDEVDAARSSAGQLQGGPLDGGRRERMLGDRDDAVASRGVGPDPPIVVDVQAEPGAPGGAVRRLGGVVARRTRAGGPAATSTGRSMPPMRCRASATTFSLSAR